MHCRAVVLAVSLLLTSLSCGSSSAGQAFDWDAWRHLPVRNGGRNKPFDTLAQETFRMLASRTRITDPQSGQRMDAHAAYLAMMFDWQGWEVAQESVGQQHPGAVYFRIHQPDRWDHLPLLHVDFPELRRALDLAAGRTHVGPLELSQAMIRLPGAGERRPFLLWTDSLRSGQDQARTQLERESLQLADRFFSYQAHRMGRRLEILPVRGSEPQWISLSDLLHSPWDDDSDATGRIREAGRQFLAARAAYKEGSADEFRLASAAFLATIAQLGSESAAYPGSSRIRLEVAYNRTVPFRFAWVFSMLAGSVLLLRLRTDWKSLYAVAWIAFAASLAAMLIGFSMRVAISGRAPIANMYESVIYVALGVAILGMIWELRHRTQYALFAASAVATVALVLADISPVALDPGLHPLQPVLRSNFWLVSHVMPITLSYSAFALAMGGGHVALSFHLAGSRNSEIIDRVTDFIYRAIQVGVLLLAAGTALGGIWADYAWGRFWSWDPKEVWALITLLGYLAVLHARHAGWIRQFGLAALSVICFSLVVMAWYGVNFVLGAGLHSYGFGDGGRGYVLAALATQLLFVTAAAWVHARRLRTERQERMAVRRRNAAMKM
ncbi:MAG: cytochrome c biogenesis protein CcsA [Pirellulaceae bacterium]|nr:cytochrome c biogenesis protein CcsA [Pirellulaceae bacterium]